MTNKKAAAAATKNAPAKPNLSQLVEAFEQQVLAKKYDKAIASLRAAFNLLEPGKEGFGKQLGSVPLAAEQEATRFAAAITNLLLDPEFVLTRASLIAFTAQKRVLCQLFEISGYRGTSHFLRMFGSRDDKGQTRFTGTELPKLFCGLSLNAMTEQLFDVLLRMKPDVSWPLVNGFLSEQILWSPNAEQVRSKILSSGKHWENISPTIEILRSLGPAYMGCSYADAPHKHDIKRSMNKMVRKWLEEQNVTDIEIDAQARRGVKRKPTLIVMAELYNSIHAMHRCYGPAIRSLKDRFKLIYMSAEGKCDEKLHYMFDKIDTTKFNIRDPKPFFDKAKSYRPDVVYYPSIGMRPLSILGSNVRLAPIQVMTFGHPATSYSECVDYAVLVDGQVGSEDTVNETILYRPSTPRWEKRPDAKKIKPVFSANPSTVRIAVPAWSRKVTPQFLSTCQEIEKRSRKKVEFVFFPNGVGSLFQAFKRRIEAMMSARVFPRTNYNSYIENLNRCDIFLSTFPFGATNGIIDAALQGLPVVNMAGGEVHACTDSDIVAKTGQPSWLTTNTQEEYITAVLRLIDNDDERIAIGRSIASINHDADLLLEANKNSAEFGIAVESVYRNLEKIQEEGRASWTSEQLADLMAAHP